MLSNAFKRGNWQFRTAIGASALAFLGMGLASAGYSAGPEAAADPVQTATPIKHVIVIIGENRSFDHVFGLYQPHGGQTVSNLLSKGIVKEDGTPGPQFSTAAQFRTSGQTAYFISTNAKTGYTILPPPDLGGTPKVASDSSPPPFATLAEATLAEPDLQPADLVLLTTGASGLGSTTGPDTRITDALSLPNGPFQLTGKTLPYDSYTGDTIHRFYQMWQQLDCDVGNETSANPAGCLSDLCPFVALTSRATNQGGGTAMAFYSVKDGDAPFLEQLADKYTMSDNYHQPVMGGTAVQHIMLGTGDAIFFSDGNGNPLPPAAALIANPNPQLGHNNRYTLDGWYSNCSDSTQPGVAPIANYLASLPYAIGPTNCDTAHYYLLNNLNPGFNADGTLNGSPSAVPPSTVPTIGDALLAKNISWRYYGGMFNRAVAGTPNAYCGICNPFQYAKSIMMNNTVRTTHLKDVLDLYSDITDNTVPSVSFVKPDGLLDGHPASSKLDLFEAFVKDILDRIQAKPGLFADTAIFVTVDESGGYYDSGYIQPLDFFGDGPRIPLIVVSPFSTGGRVVHSYTDHVSIIKFIEKNWGLNPLTPRSRDNLHNPVAAAGNPYVPTNSPAIGDLMDVFHFD